VAILSDSQPKISTRQILYHRLCRRRRRHRLRRRCHWHRLRCHWRRRHRLKRRLSSVQDVLLEVEDVIEAVDVVVAGRGRGFGSQSGVQRRLLRPA